MAARLKPLLALIKLSKSLTPKERDENYIQFFDDGSGMVTDQDGTTLATWDEFDTVDEIFERITKAVKSKD